MHGRSNTHGEKAIAPALAMAVPTGHVMRTSQQHALPISVKTNGYRKKRNNAYGDEVLPPTAGFTISMPVAVEQPPARAEQSYGSVVPALVEASGYRKKRNNAYGDEAIRPETNLPVSMATPVEQAPAQADQSYAAIAAVVSSGY